VSSVKKTPVPRPERPPEPLSASEESEWPEEEWEGGASRRTLSFYHAAGAPFLDDEGKLHEQPTPEEVAELRRQGLAVPPAIVEEIVGLVVPIREERERSAAVPVRAAGSRTGRNRAATEERWRQESGQGSRRAKELPSARRKQALDLSIVEEAAYLVMNRVFREGVRIPIRKEGVADLDVIIKDKEVVIDVNRLIFDAPKLSVWRITLAYQGEPLAMVGRGVKGDLKINPFNMARFLVRVWLEKRKYDKQARRETTG